MTKQAFIFLALWFMTTGLLMFQASTIKKQAFTINKCITELDALYERAEADEHKAEGHKVVDPVDDAMNVYERQKWMSQRTRDEEGWRYPK